MPNRANPNILKNANKIRCPSRKAIFGLCTKEWKYDWWNHGINPITGHHDKKQTLNPRGPMPKPEDNDNTTD